MDNIPPKAIAETINASTGFFIQAPFKYKNEGNQIFNETAADISSQQYHDFFLCEKVSSCSDINVRSNKTATQRRELIFTL
ncbi:hypothetical protein IVZ55_12135 [Salmonella enterica subsp. enterica serovar Worthington]|nr:hypothetical protein [Salmonella enterica subsp. enterica serovar Worthington]